MYLFYSTILIENTWHDNKENCDKSICKTFWLTPLYLYSQGFLIEAKLTKLLQPLDKDEQSLMKLDAIFSVSTSCINDTAYSEGYQNILNWPASWITQIVAEIWQTVLL